jgi:hypothetical protein
MNQEKEKEKEKEKDLIDTIVIPNGVIDQASSSLNALSVALNLSLSQASDKSKKSSKSENNKSYALEDQTNLTKLRSMITASIVLNKQVSQTF